MLAELSARIPKSVIKNLGLAFVGKLLRNILLPVITIRFNSSIIHFGCKHNFGRKPFNGDVANAYFKMSLEVSQMSIVASGFHH